MRLLEILDVYFLEKLKIVPKGLAHIRLLLGTLAGMVLGTLAGLLAPHSGTGPGWVGSCPPRSCPAFKVGFFLLCHCIT